MIPPSSCVTANASLAPGREVRIQNVVVHSSTPMRPLRVVITEPSFANVIQLGAAETYEVIEAFAFEGANEGFTISISFRRLYWRLDHPYPFGFPELLHVLGKYNVPISN